MHEHIKNLEIKTSSVLSLICACFLSNPITALKWGLWIVIPSLATVLIFPQKLWDWIVMNPPVTKYFQSHGQCCRWEEGSETVKSSHANICDSPVVFFKAAAQKPPLRYSVALALLVPAVLLSWTELPTLVATSWFDLALPSPFTYTTRCCQWGVHSVCPAVFMSFYFLKMVIKSRVACAYF